MPPTLYSDRRVPPYTAFVSGLKTYTGSFRGADLLLPLEEIAHRVGLGTVKENVSRQFLEPVAWLEAGLLSGEEVA